MNTITIEPNSKADYQLFIGLAKRLKARFSVNSLEESKTISSKTKKESRLLAFFGVFEDVDSKEMIKSIEVSRTTKEIDKK